MLLRALIWPGLALLTAGLVAGLVGAWTLLPISLLVTGVVLILLSIGLGGYAFGQFWQSRSTQAGGNALVATLSMLVILGLINFVGARYDQRLDLTENQLFTLSPESQTVAKSLAQPTQVIIFDRAPNATDQQLLESYRRANPELTYDYIDPFVERQLAEQYGLTAPGEVYLKVGSTAALKAGEKPLLVQRLSPQERLSERSLTNKLNQLGQQKETVIYFLQGHGEYKIDGTEAGLLEAATGLKEKSFTVEAFNLAETREIPEDASVVVVAGPQQAFFDAEREQLATYLEQGGGVLILIDPQVETGLEPLLKDWGVSLNDRLIVDTSGGGQAVGLGPAAPLVTTYGNHPITADFKNGRSFYPLARPVAIAPSPDIQATPLLLSNATSYAELISEAGELEVDTQNSPKGPFNIGVALSQPVPKTSVQVKDPEKDGEEAVETDPESQADADPESQADADPESQADADAESQADADPESQADADPESQANADAEPPLRRSDEGRLVVIGNSSFATDGLFGQQLNGDVFLNSVTWLSQVENSALSIRAKEITNRRIVMTVAQQITVIVLALLVLPAVGLLGAGLMWLKRR